MPPQIDSMIQSPYHHSNHGGGPPSGSSNGSNPPSSYNSSQGQAHVQDGRGKQSSQQQQNSPPNSHGNQMYMQPSHMMGNPPYMGHNHHMQHPPYHMQQQQQGQHMSSPHHPQQGHPHGYPMPPHNVYHQGHYPPYHMQMHGHGHSGSYPPQHPYAMQQSRSGNSSVSSKMGDKEYNEPNNGFNSKGGPIATAVSKKTMKDTFSAPASDMDAVLNVEPMRSDFFFFLQEMQGDLMAEASKEVLKSISSPLKDLEGDLAKLQMENEDKPHPYLLFSNINEKIISKWEELPQEKRSDYLILEEADRKRFMTADEVASRHCATLTARSRSPQPFTPKNKDKGRYNETQKNDNKNNNEKDEGSLSPTVSLSVNKMLQTEGEKKDMEEKRARSSSEMNVENEPDEVLAESPTKKIKPDPIEQAKKLYGELMFLPEKHETLSKQELLDLAEKIPKTASENSSNPERDLEFFKVEREKFLNAAEKASKELQLDEEKINIKKEDEYADDMDDYEHEEAMEIELLLDRRVRQVRGRRVKEYLVRWKGHDKESDSWEPYKNVEHCEELIKEIDEKKRIEKENALKNASKE